MLPRSTRRDVGERRSHPAINRAGRQKKSAEEYQRNLSEKEERISEQEEAILDLELLDDFQEKEGNDKEEAVDSGR